MKKRRALLLSIFFVLALCVACGWWLHRERQQYALNRQLIDALKHGDIQQALALVNAGADPNTRYDPPPAPTFQLLLNQLLHHTPPPVNDSPTAFLIPCVGEWPIGLRPFHDSVVLKKRVPQVEKLLLLKAMLVHGANVKAKTKTHSTALHLAVRQQQDAIIALMLQHGADVNAPDEDGNTPLMEACNTNTVEGARLLLSHGAQPNIQNKVGRTALFYAVIWPPANGVIPDLLAHGANPCLPDRDKVTPLQMAHNINRPDLLRVLKRAAK